jgi:hypothetical protein
MSFTDSATDLNKIIALTTFIGEADSLLRDQTDEVVSYDIEDVKFATNAVLPNSPTYSNGTLGDGATLESGSNAVLSIDANVMQVGFRVLVKNQASALQNGIYTVTSIGSGSSHWVLTRATDFDTTSEILQYSKIKVTSGSVNEGRIYFLSSASSPTVGTDNLTFSQYPADATAQFFISEFRKQFDDMKSESEFDNARTVISTARSTELNLPTSINSQFSSICAALNSFYTNQYGAKFKTYFADVYATGQYDTDLGGSALPVWTDNFRTLWRNTIGEELIVRLGSVTKTAGSWGSFVADKSIELDTALIVKIKQTLATVAAGTDSMPVTIALNDSAANAYVSTVNIPLGAAAENTYSITTTTKSTFASIQTVTISNSYGDNGDIVEFWVSV